MIFIVSDLHLGKKPESDSDSLRALEACIKASEATTVVFLGDVFDAFIESGHHLPKVVQKWGSMAQRLRDAEVSVHYLMGNHDRWHRRYVLDITGEQPVRGSMILPWNGQPIHFEHGDDGQSHRPLTTAARWLSDQTWVHRLYTTLLPFGGAQHLAAAVSRRFASFEPDPHTVKALKEHAVRTLQSTEAPGVIMGHCHQSGLVDLSEEVGRAAWYANSGDWYESRSFVLLGEENVTLCSWQDTGIRVLAELSV